MRQPLLGSNGFARGDGAVVYLDAVDFTQDGTSSTFYFMTTYILHGRTVGVVLFNQNGVPIDRDRVRGLVGSAAQRLAVNAPA